VIAWTPRLENLLWRKIVNHWRAVCGLTLLAFEAVSAWDGTCDLDSARGKIRHVIYVEFDNTHFRRDNPNVPSDLEQMPHLLNFIRANGTLDTNITRC